MNNFAYHNPVKIIFGQDTIPQVAGLISRDKRILMTYGGGSIKRTGVYDQVKRALSNHTLLEFGGIEPNPKYETLMNAVALGRQEKADFLLSVGGGSVLDGSKFIAAAVPYPDGDPWDLLARKTTPHAALPIGCILTLPATGSEMNMFAVISRESTREKLAFGHPLVYPQFSILDPKTTFSLDQRQTRNGIVDAFVHVMEQYLTYPIHAPLQDRQAEAILQTLIEVGPGVLQRPHDYDLRASLMWSATQALNGLIACGVPQDWTTHMVGHELTAFFGLDHGQTLAIVLPAVWRQQKQAKAAKLTQYAERVWGVTTGDKAEQAIEKTVVFFQSLGQKTKLAEYGIGSERFEEIGERFAQRGTKLGEHQTIGKKDVLEILHLCR